MHSFTSTCAYLQTAQPDDCVSFFLSFSLSQTHQHTDTPLCTHCPLTLLPIHKRTINSECVSARVHMFLVPRCVCRCVWWAVRGRGPCVFLGAEQSWAPAAPPSPVHSSSVPPPLGKRRSLCVCASEAAPVRPSVPRGIQWIGAFCPTL